MSDPAALDHTRSGPPEPPMPQPRSTHYEVEHGMWNVGGHAPRDGEADHRNSSDPESLSEDDELSVREGSSDIHETDDDNDDGSRAQPIVAPPFDPQLQLINVHRIVNLYHAAERVDSMTNADLIRHLRRGGALSKESVISALSLCPRGRFVPLNYQDVAYVDSPIRVMEHGFNISAPHMHARCLEVLDLQPADRFLDVGCGCGVLTAAAAHMVGRAGVVVGLDIRQAAITMSQDNWQRLAQQDAMYAAAACVPTFDLHNVFLPAARHRGKYTHVHVGAMCPESRVAVLLQLLSPEGGTIVVPVGNELRLLVRSADGSLKHTVVSHVRYSDLEVPREVDVILAAAKEEEEARRRVLVPPSTFSQDLRAVQMALTTRSSSLESSYSPARDLDMEQAAAPRASGDLKRTKLSCTSESPSCSSKDGSSSSSACFMQLSSEEVASVMQQLGPPDVTLLGVERQLLGEAHRAMLEARCGVCRALFNSGMRDASAPFLHVPEDFSKRAVEGLLHYVYHDEVPADLSEQQVVDVLLVAAYYGCHQLVAQCEARLAEAVASSNDMELAASLMALAEANGLEQLGDVVLSYAVEGFERLSVTDAYCQLPRHLVDRVTRACYDKYWRVMGAIRDAAPL